MNITIDKRKFSDAVGIVSRFAERRSGGLAALSSILLVVGDDGIKFRATNLETGVDLRIEGDIKSEGVVAIPATILREIASSLNGEGSVSIEASGSIAVIKVGTAKSSIKTAPYDDFPSIPFPESPKNRFVLSGEILRSVLNAIANCASTSTVRPELASIYLSIEGGMLTAVATDSFRLVEKKVPLQTKANPSKVLIPAKNALEIAQALPEEDVIVSFDEHQCAFVTSHMMLVSRLTSANYPDYRQIIPKESVAEATTLKKDFDMALKRATVFSDAFQKVKIAFDPKTKSIEFSARNQEVGESSESISAQVQGNPIELSFNHRYLGAVSGLTQAESLNFSMSGIGRPLVIKGVGDASFLYLVSPMNQ